MSDFHLYRVRECEGVECYVAAKSYRDAVERWAGRRLAEDPETYGNVEAVLAVEQPDGVDLICDEKDLILPAEGE